MKSTQAMRDRCRELSKPNQDDYDRAVICIIDDLEAALASHPVQEAGQGVLEFANAILHGDEEHRRWLLEAANAFIAGEKLPAPRALPARPEAPEVREALEESVKLQSHYAALLNDYDGGQRLQFKSAQDWLDRLYALASQPVRGEGT